jgi:hydroxylaminobenzene mutase
MAPSTERVSLMSIHRSSRQILIHGLALVLFGLVWGLVIPGTPHPRLALGAHIQFVTNGMLFIVLATALLALPHSVGLRSVWVMVVAAWLTWAMAMSEVSNSWWGTLQTLPIAASQAGATGGEPWQELVVKLTHIGAGLGLIIAWSLLVVGFVKHPSRTGSDEG